MNSLIVYSKIFSETELPKLLSSLFVKQEMSSNGTSFKFVLKARLN